MEEENGMVSALRKRPKLPEIITAGVLFYLLFAWAIFYLVDVSNFLGLRDLLVSTGALQPPAAWYSLFREGGLTEILQWVFLACTAYYARVLGKDLRSSGDKRAATFWFLMSLAAMLMFLEDAVNIRHALSFMARLAFSAYRPELIRSIFELAYFAVLGSIPLYALLRYGRSVLHDKRTRRFLFTGFAAYALAVGASGSRFIADWYTAAGRMIHDAVGRGSLIIPAGWEVADLEFFLMDWIVEESIELVGAATLFAAALTYFSKMRITVKHNGGVTPQAAERPPHS